MKAKDTKWCPQHGYPLPCDKCGMPLTQLQQDEIHKAGYEEAVRFTHRQFDLNLPEVMELSKQEGRMEVVEFIEKRVYYVDKRGYVALKPNATSNWVAKLKEWGIDV